MSAPQAKVALWEDVVLRTIAIYKLLHGLFFIGVGFGLLRLRHHNVVEFLNAHVILPYHLNPESRIVDWLLDKAQTITSHKLSILGYAAFFYAALFLAEGIGLYLKKHWAEYMVVIVTGSFLLPEGYWLYEKLEWLKLVLMLGNILIITYLIHRLRLDSRISANPPDDTDPPGPQDGKSSPPEGKTPADKTVNQAGNEAS